jgi:aryl-alcohol dehydrogenase-like predicted oxidoreductase
MPTQLDHYRLLGRSGLRLSPLSLGTMNFGVGQGGWGAEDRDAGQIFNHYLECGGNSIDTANFYGTGGSEQVLAKLIEGRREQLVLATKYTLSMRRGDPNASGNHRKNMVQSVENSLRRLETDFIDLLYLHVWDSRTPVEEILRAFDDLVRAGKILYVGLSDTPAWQASRMQAIAELRGWSPLIALQVPYNLTERTVERELLPMALEMGMGVLPWSPLAGGVLSGKYDSQDLGPPGAAAARAAAVVPPAAAGTPTAGQPPAAGQSVSRKNINIATGRLSERNLGIAAVVKAVAQELNRTPAQVALAWTLRHPAVVSPIIGARTLVQLKENLACLQITFTDEQVAQLDAVSRIDPGFPHTMLTSAAIPSMFGHVTVTTATRT